MNGQTVRKINFSKIRNCFFISTYHSIFNAGFGIFAPGKMERTYTYQQDTNRVKIPVESLPANQESGNLRIERSAPLPIEPIRTRNEVNQELDSAETVTKTSQPQQTRPTAAQIRYWRRQREQELKVGDSKYIEPRNDSILITSEKPEADLVLPADKINRINNDWIIVLLLIALVLFATVSRGWSKYLGNLFQSVVNYSTSNRMFREQNYSFQHASFRLDVYFYLVFSVFLYQLIHFFGIDYSFQNYQLYLLIFAGIWIFFTIKKFLYRFTGVIFENKGETSEFLFNLDNSIRVTGLIIFPVVAIISFSPFNSLAIPVYFGILIVSVVYFLLLFRGFVILLKKQFSILYLFLYFCTLEILPLVLVYKILVI
jgi:hypothetical protein